MTDYQEQALRTEAPITVDVSERMVDAARAVHAIIGIQTEAGELSDIFKRWIFYGRGAAAANGFTQVDTVHVREEVGDVLWYLAILADAIGTTIDDCQRRNIEKLRTRYPDKFTEDAAVFRDLPAERSALEAGR